MPEKYRKKPVVIEAVQWAGGNVEEVRAFAGDDVGYHHATTGSLYIKTLEGDHRANVGDFIIKGVHGEHYPCKPDIFDLTYERA